MGRVPNLRTVGAVFPHITTETHPHLAGGFFAMWRCVAQQPREPDLPSWWGREDIMTSHRSNLIRKFPEHYAGLWAGVPDDLPYVWE